MRTLLLKHFRDPIWQALGVVVTILVALLSVYVSYDVYRRSAAEIGLQILWMRTEVPNIVSGDNSVVLELRVNGETTRGLRIDRFSLQNSGNASIRPEDFVQPLTVSVEPPLRIAAIGSGEQGRLTLSRPLELKWKRTSPQEFKLDPLLINPTDSSEVVVYIAADDPRQFSGFDDASPKWKTRIAGLPNVYTARFEDVYNRTISWSALSIYVYQRDSEVYLTVGLFIVLFALAARLGEKWTTKDRARSVFVLAAIGVASLGTALLIVSALGLPSAQPLLIGSGLVYAGITVWLIRSHPKRQRVPKAATTTPEQVA